MKDGEFENRQNQENTIVNPGEETIKSSDLNKNKGLMVVVSPSNFGQAFIIDKDSTIGRHESCNITIDDPLISKKHCSIEIGTDGTFYIKDLGSTNFTFVNRKKITSRKQLFYGDRLVLGNTILRFLLEETLD